MKRIILVVCVLAFLSAIMVIPASATTETFSPDADSLLLENTPDANCDTIHDYLCVMSRDTGRNRRSVIHFDLSSIPSGATIDSATLNLRIWNVNDNRTDDIHRVTESWVESEVTWNSIFGDYVDTPTDSASTGTTVDTWVEWDVTSDMQAFVDDTPNYGWLIKDHTESESAKYVKYYSREYADETKRPYLEVTYSEAPAEWTLALNGAITEVMNQSTFEGGVACHNVSWTDSKDRTWTGMPLWKLVGWVDDSNKHDFNDTLADAGYNVTVIAGDGYSKTFNSTFVKRNDNIILANELNGTAIPEDSDSYPLRLTGSDLTSGQNVKNVVGIRLTFPPPPSASLTATANVKITMVGISLNRTAVDYGTVGAGQNSDNESVDITNIGTSDVNVTLEVNGTTATAQSFYEQSLHVDGNLYNLATIIAQIPTSNSEDVVTQLRVPSSWTEAGKQDATFVFWAKA